MVDALTTNDGLGRPVVQQRRQGPGASQYDSVETGYDSVGAAAWTTVPYSGTEAAGTTLSATPYTVAEHDNLGRSVWVGTYVPGGGLIGPTTSSYSGNDVYVTVGPAPTGENAKRRQFEYDALGRLTSVCEVTSGTGSGSCAQTNAVTGFWTKYTYDGAGRLTNVTQNAQSGSTQTRSFAYDLAGRMTSETNPENGTTTYTFDTDATCGSSAGDLVKRADAVGNVTCFGYDGLHRLLAVAYSGPYSGNTPSKHFVFDSATVNGVAMTNVKGRLAEAYTCTSCPGTKITDVGFSYTTRGETSDVYELTPHSGGYYHVNAGYWANGALNTLSPNLTGVPTTWTFGVDGEGRPSTVTATSGQSPVTATAYNAYASPPNV